MTTTIAKSWKERHPLPSITSVQKKLEPFSMEGLTEMVEGLTPISSMDRPTTWTKRAACTSAPIEAFFPTGVGGKVTSECNRSADTYCKGCPVRLECLASALLEEYVDPAPLPDPNAYVAHPVNESHGLKGGLLPSYRLAAAKQMGLAA